MALDKVELREGGVYVASGGRVYVSEDGAWRIKPPGEVITELRRRAAALDKLIAPKRRKTPKKT